MMKRLGLSIVFCVIGYTIGWGESFSASVDLGVSFLREQAGYKVKAQLTHTELLEGWFHPGICVGHHGANTDPYGRFNITDLGIVLGTGIDAERLGFKQGVLSKFSAEAAVIPRLSFYSFAFADIPIKDQTAIFGISFDVNLKYRIKPQYGIGLFLTYDLNFISSGYHYLTVGIHQNLIF